MVLVSIYVAFLYSCGVIVIFHCLFFCSFIVNRWRYQARLCNTDPRWNESVFPSTFINLRVSMWVNLYSWLPFQQISTHLYLCIADLCEKHGNGLALENKLVAPLPFAQRARSRLNHLYICQVDIVNKAVFFLLFFRFIAYTLFYKNERYVSWRQQETGNTFFA